MNILEHMQHEFEFFHQQKDNEKNLKFLIDFELNSKNWHGKEFEIEKPKFKKKIEFSVVKKNSDNLKKLF